MHKSGALAHVRQSSLIVVFYSSSVHSTGSPAFSFPVFCVVRQWFG